MFLLCYWPDSLTAEDIVKLDIIKKEVLLAETTLERRKARVNKYLQWVSEAGRCYRVSCHKIMHYNKENTTANYVLQSTCSRDYYLINSFHAYNRMHLVIFVL